MGDSLISSWLRQHDQIARTADIYSAGFSKRDVASEVKRGLVTRAGRSWVCTLSCPRDLRWAAMLGGHLTCVSAAKHYGLWTLHDDRCHIAVRNHSNVQPNRAKVRLHYGTGPIARSRNTVVDPVVNVLVGVAKCQSLERALVVADSAVRAGHISRTELRSLHVRSAAFARVAAAVSELSDSGIETLPRLRLSAAGIHMRQQVRIAGHRVDGLVGERLVLQFDGADHLSREQKQTDARHDNELRLMGYTVLRFTYQDVVEFWPYVEASVQRALAQGAHLAPSTAA